jgi:hypothetical protein
VRSPRGRDGTLCDTRLLALTRRKDPARLLQLGRPAPLEVELIAAVDTTGLEHAPGLYETQPESTNSYSPARHWERGSTDRTIGSGVPAARSQITPRSGFRSSKGRPFGAHAAKSTGSPAYSTGATEPLRETRNEYWHPSRDSATPAEM